MGANRTNASETMKAQALQSSVAAKAKRAWRGRSGTDLFLGRQPIVDRRRHVVAYELLYRASRVNFARVRNTDAAGGGPSASAGAAAGIRPADGMVNGVVATARVMHRALRRIGLNTVLGPCAGFINVDGEMLASSRIASLPPDRVVLELLETIRVDAAVIARCRQLKAMGYRLALDDFVSLTADSEPLLELADIVKIDVPQLSPQALTQLVARLKIYPARLLAEKVDTRERARHCLELGFHYFQGYFFARPGVLPV